MTAPILISTQVTTVASGNLTVPSDCTLIIALRHDTSAPTFNGAGMTVKAATNNIGIYEVILPATGTVAYTGRASWLYFKDAVSMPNAIAGYSSGGDYSQTLTTNNDDIMVGSCIGSLTDTAKHDLSFHAVACTYTYKTGNYFNGYLSAASASEICRALAWGSGETVYASFMSVKGVISFTPQIINS